MQRLYYSSAVERGMALEVQVDEGALRVSVAFKDILSQSISSLKLSETSLIDLRVITVPSSHFPISVAVAPAASSKYRIVSSSLAYIDVLVVDGASKAWTAIDTRPATSGNYDNPKIVTVTFPCDSSCLQTKEKACYAYNPSYEEWEQKSCVVVEVTGPESGEGMGEITCECEDLSLVAVLERIDEGESGKQNLPAVAIVFIVLGSLVVLGVLYSFRRPRQPKYAQQLLEL